MHAIKVWNICIFASRGETLSVRRNISRKETRRFETGKSSPTKRTDPNKILLFRVQCWRHTFHSWDSEIWPLAKVSKFNELTSTRVPASRTTIDPRYHLVFAKFHWWNLPYVLVTIRIERQTGARLRNFSGWHEMNERASSVDRCGSWRVFFFLYLCASHSPRIMRFVID